MKAEKNLTNVTYEIQDATQLPAEWTGKFDLAVCYDVIHDLGRPDLGVQELSRVLKKSETLSWVKKIVYSKLMLYFSRNIFIHFS